MRELLDRYAQAIFGCNYEDLEDREKMMLKYYIEERENDKFRST